MTNADKNPSMQEILTQIRSILTDNEKKDTSEKIKEITPAKPREVSVKLTKIPSHSETKKAVPPVKPIIKENHPLTTSEKIFSQVLDEEEETTPANLHLGVLSRFDMKDELAFEGGAQSLPTAELTQSQELINKTKFLKQSPLNDVFQLTNDMVYKAPSVIDDDVLENLSDVMSKEISKSLMITYLQPKVKNWLRENLPFYLKDIKLKKIN